MIKDSSNVMKVALTVAVRYAAVRRQGNERNGVETALLDYQTHQYKLMPLLASTFAINFTAQYMESMYRKMEEGLNSGDASALPDVHASSAGLKSLCTWTAHNAIDICRQSCGGHGYSAYVGK
jgi:acyl-CoA oxidase